jgi:hypothetical protein
MSEVDVPCSTEAPKPTRRRGRVSAAKTLNKERMTVTEYRFPWSNKWLTAKAKTLDDMIDSLQAAVDELRAMKAAGVVLRDDGCAEDDYATLVTSDRAVAKKFGFIK